MKVSRKKTRRYLLQKLYARIYGEVINDNFQSAFFDGILDFEVDDEYLNEMFEIIIKKQKTLIAIIEKYAPKFDMDTMFKPSILSMFIAISEMLWLKEEIPAKVSMNEAIELTKYFGDETSKNIVNGILNSFYKEIANFSAENIKTSQKEFFQEL